MSVPTELNQIQVNKNPLAEVNFEWDKPDSTFKFATVKYNESDLKQGFVLVKVLYLSNDPAQKGWMQKGVDPRRTYISPVLEGDPVRSLGIGEVVESNSHKFAKGDIVSCSCSWSDYAIVDQQSIFTKIDTSSGLPVPVYLSSLGLTGLTAYFGLTEVGQFKEGQTLVVSAASGATGSMVVQIAKHLLKAGKVIGITGSPEKANYVKSLGADLAVDYHDETWKQQLGEYLGDDFADVYFDNVGGEILSFMLKNVKSFGTVVSCGSISGYIDRTKGLVDNWTQITVNSLTVKGFVVINYRNQFPQAVHAIVEGIKLGKIKVTEGYTIEDLSNDPDTLLKVPRVWNKLFTNEKPNGKLITKV
ncbi:NAD(P)-binding protein [Hyphopichia burtonii NRRL Y-1933]|uniref:NAD(P)-binding protein n=1 Tax=Hyphopichia burtonii NRRL Y-1933 TaxID=984485 RepID=A0A1E4RCB6_9ASCO|nr:NAD(P)-binding protein [Hyphopichia burtonii NRRL Y-1933]ODV64918.1 NAD(P)-binding protein [Hyphopichia burtonii NRRL Y-1933]